MNYKTFVEIKETERPIQAIKIKDTLRLNRPANKPIIGGPNKKPKKPIVDTVASATPADSVLDLPATL